MRIDADADVRCLEVDPQPPNLRCGDEFTRVFGSRGVPADDRVDLLETIDLLAFVLVEGAAQEFDILRVLGKLDAILLAAFDGPAVLEVDASLDRRGGVCRGKEHYA